MSKTLDTTHKATYIVVIKDIINNVVVKSFIASTTLSQLWSELEVFYGSANIRSKKTGNLEDPILLAPSDYRAIVLGEVLDTGVIKTYTFDVSRSVYQMLSYFGSSQWSKSREQRTE